MKSAIEIVRFKLTETATPEQLIAASEQSQKFISSLPGFEYRSLSFDQASNTWTDVVYWESMESAKAADEHFMANADCQALVELIDQQSVNIEHQTIMMSDLAEKYR